MSLALLQSAMLLPLELAVNQVLALDAASARKLAALDGGTLAIHIRQPAFDLFVSCIGGKLRLSPRHEGPATATLLGPASSLLRLLLKGEPIAGLQNSSLELRGNTGFAQALQSLLLESRIDWEFQLSRLIGDIPTQVVADSVGHSKDYLQRTAQRITRDVGDFLLEEGRVIPAAGELEAFYGDVQDLVLRLDRLDARLSQHDPRKA